MIKMNSNPGKLLVIVVWIVCVLMDTIVELISTGKFTENYNRSDFDIAP